MMLKRILLANLVAAAWALPAQAAEIPQSANLKYSGTMGIPATMTFNRNGDNYKVVANINVPLYKIRFESGGKIVGNDLKPSYYTDTRNGKLYAYTKFSGNRVTYGKAGESYTKTVSGSVMDLFTLSWQLAFNEGKLPSNMHITNGKKISRLGAFVPTGSKQMSVAGKKTAVNQFTAHRGDGNVFYGFAPVLNNVPAQIGYNDDDGSKYNLTLKSATINGKTVQP
ncbi:DUF3108 domain-containing protein [Alysiella filiformis]|nr:DUF3108 domain-containing protein [Alysiella filiformis]QMT30809.1 DUF3108 domain-containing protein [Alysiella filiformis]